MVIYYAFRKLIERIKKGEVDQANVTTAEDFEEASKKERAEFQVASRVTGKNGLESFKIDSYLSCTVQ